ncbi:MAG TPA: carboxypeptidase regulatory-like domain-containing protein [Bryobacteraceae bacterium]
MLLLRRFGWWLLVYASMVSIAAAQSATGSLRGILTDNSGAVIPGATVNVVGHGMRRSAGTQVDGSFTVSGLAPGDYTIRLSFPGFNPVNREVTVAAGSTVQAPIQLTLSSERQVLTVAAESGQRLTVEPESNATALVLRGQDLEALPDDPDDLQSALVALAGPAAGPNGAEIFVDGFSGGAMPPKDAIREIRINQNPFSAEYDKLGMGRIEVFTKPGSDKLRGALYLNAGNGIFNARNPYSSNKPDYSNYMFGGSLSGPLGKRASFFLNVDQRYIDNNEVIHATLVNPSTLQPEPYQRSVLSPFRNTFVNPRVDYQLTPNNTLVARYQYTTTNQNDAGIGQFNLPSRAYTLGSLEHNWQLTETAVLNAEMVNETRFQYSRTSTFQDGSNAMPAVVVASAFTEGSSQVGNSYNHLDHSEATNSTSIVHGTHTIRFGVRARLENIASSSSQNFGGTFSFFGAALAPVLLDPNNPVIDSSNVTLGSITSLQQYERTLLLQQYNIDPATIRLAGGGASLFTLSTGNPLTRFSQFDVAPFFQDDWRMRPNLTLSLGMRYETQTNIGDRRDWAPRIGLAWSPKTADVRHRTVIRAGVGMFYDRVGENTVLESLRFNGVTQQQYTVRNPDFFPNLPTPLQLASEGQLETVYRLDRDLRAPYLLESAASVERQLPASTTVSVTYVNVHGMHLLQNVNINTPFPGTTINPYPGQGPIFQYESGGIFNQNMMLVTFNTRPTRGVTLFGSYSLTKMMSDVDNGGSPSDPYDFRLDYGRSTLERRHRFQLVGSVAAPLGLRLNPFVIVTSGAPYDMVIGEDLNGDSLSVPLERPAFATNLNSKTVRATQFGAFDLNPQPGGTIVPRNYLTGTGLVSLNLRLARTFGFGSRTGSAGISPTARLGDGSLLSALDGGGDSRVTLTFSVIAVNIINHTNHGGYVGQILSPLFGESTMLNGGFGGGVLSAPANNRRLEFQTRVAF